MSEEKGGQMKDLDLDELHQAVSKMMDQKGKPKSKREPSKTVAKVARPEVKLAERPVAETVEPAAENITVRRSVPRVQPKSRGMAMDVVQVPKPGVVPPPSAQAARVAPTLQPTGPVRPEPPTPRASSVPAATPDEKAPDLDEDVLASINLQADGIAKHGTTIVEPPHAATFPDPLDVHGFKDEEDEKAVSLFEPEQPPKAETTMEHAAAQVEPATQEDVAEDLLFKDDIPGAPQVAPAKFETDETPSLTPAAEDTAATPFVSNAKIEKRPLGAYNENIPAKPAPAQPVEAPEEPTEKASVATGQPHELSPEVVAVESAEPEFAPTKPADEAPKEDLRAMSIPQQYRAPDKAPAKEDRPIFDTKEYHTPLKPVASAHHGKGSAVKVVLIIILIIVLIVIGVEAYLVMTGQTDLTGLLKLDTGTN